MEGTTMKKAYLQPTMEVMEGELAQMLCSSTVINPGEPNKPAGARDSGGWGFWDDNVEEEKPNSGGSIWDEE
jgi:hypothetical protein